MSLWSWEKKQEDNSYKLAEENVKLKQHINYLEDQVEKYKTRLDSEYAKASYSMDWGTMNAFSVERMIENGMHKTIIGYLIAEPVTTVQDNVTYKDVVREWSLYCSHQQHEKLVAEFNEYKKTK
jgi:hypothetical protein